MARATSSLPVPLSPRIRTVESLLATRDNKILHLTHGFALADDHSFQVQLRLQAAILAAQRLGGQNIFQRDRGNASNRIQEVDMPIFELILGADRGQYKTPTVLSTPTRGTQRTLSVSPESCAGRLRMGERSHKARCTISRRMLSCGEAVA